MLQGNKTSLLELPVEVRYQIYSYLFCHKPSPITLGIQDFFSKWALSSPFDEPQEPTFYTALFRVNKAVSRDAVRFAYSSNSFRFDKDIETFCRLGPIALASIKTLRVYKNAWLSSGYATGLWETLNRSCSGLELLVAEAASHVLQGAIPYLKDYMASIPAGCTKPRLILDLTVLERHFSFDFPDREYQSALQELHDNVEDRKWQQFNLQSTYVMRLPRQVKEIQFVVAIGPGAYRALHETLKEHPDLGFVESEDVASVAGDGMEGRGKRQCFIWQNGDDCAEM